MSETESVVPKEVQEQIETAYHKVHKTKKENPKEEKKIEAVVEGRVIQRKRGTWSRIRGFFVDDGRSVGTYMVQDIAIPALRDLIFDMIKNGAERSLYGEVMVRSHSSVGRDGRFPYDKVRRSGSQSRGVSSLERKGSDRREMSDRGRRSHDFGEIVLETQWEAKDVLQQLDVLIERFDMATVADLYELINVDSNFQDSKWGWYNLDGAKAVKVREGYLLQLPRTEPIE